MSKRVSIAAKRSRAKPKSKGDKPRKLITLQVDRFADEISRVPSVHAAVSAWSEAIAGWAHCPEGPVMVPCAHRLVEARQELERAVDLGSVLGLDGRARLRLAEDRLLVATEEERIQDLEVLECANAAVRRLLGPRGFGPA